MADKFNNKTANPAQPSQPTPPTTPTQGTGGGTANVPGAGGQTGTNTGATKITNPSAPPDGATRLPGTGGQTGPGAGRAQINPPTDRTSGPTQLPGSTPAGPSNPSNIGQRTALTEQSTANAAQQPTRGADGLYRDSDGYVVEGPGAVTNGGQASGSDSYSTASDIRSAMNYASIAANANRGAQSFDPEAWAAAAETNGDTGNGTNGKGYYALENTGYDPGEGYDYTDWRNGTMTTRPEGGYTVYDGKGNRMGHYDSAGNWHGDISDTELSDSWNQYGQELINREGIQFTGDGVDKQYGRDDWTGARGDGFGPWTKQRTREEGIAEMLKGLYGDDTVLVTDEMLRNGGVNLEPGKSYVTEADLYSYLRSLGKGGSGSDSSTNIQMHDPIPGVPRAPDDSNGGGTGGGSGLNIPETPDLKPLLDQWRQAAEEQQQGRIDYAVQQGIDELTRAQEDAQKGFQTAQEQISAEEAINKDNQALYAEARGDKGGIGAAQYDSIMNTAAINRQQVREQQTQLATDTARQIADLRAKGEFEKADAVLQLSQEYLSNLMNLEQWAANYGLSAAQFAESVREWEENYKLSVANITGYLNGQRTLAGQEADRNFALNEAGITGLYNGKQTLAAREADRNFLLNQAGVTGYYNGKRTLAGENADRNYDLSAAGLTGYFNGQPTLQNTSSQQSTLASAGNALLSAGIMPSDDQLRAMGLSSEQAQALIMAAQAQAAAKSSGGGGYSAGNRDAYAALSAAGVKTEGEAYNLLRSMGYKDGDAKTFAGYYMADAEARKPTAEMEDLVDWLSNLNKTSPDVTPENKVDMFERAAKYNGWSEDQILWVAQQLGMI